MARNSHVRTVPPTHIHVVFRAFRPIDARVCRGGVAPILDILPLQGAIPFKPCHWGDPGCRSLRSLYPGLRYTCPYRAPRLQNHWFRTYYMCFDRVPHPQNLRRITDCLPRFAWHNMLNKYHGPYRALRLQNHWFRAYYMCFDRALHPQNLRRITDCLPRFAWHNMLNTL